MIFASIQDWHQYSSKSFIDQFCQFAGHKLFDLLTSIILETRKLLISKGISPSKSETSHGLIKIISTILKEIMPEGSPEGSWQFVPGWSASFFRLNASLF